MPGYIKQQLHKYAHLAPNKPQSSPYPAPPKKYGAAAQELPPEDTSLPLSTTDKKRVQQILGSILYYARAVDITVLVALSSIAAEQAKATNKTMTNIKQLLDYCSTYPDAKIRFRASDMILNIHSDASYLCGPRERSRVAGYFFLGWLPQEHMPI